MTRQQLLARLDKTWTTFQASYADLSDQQMTEPGVVGDWSVKDLLGHVTTWEEEALHWLPVIAEGGRPPRYAATGGLDAFNARTSEQKRARSLDEIRRQLAETHARLLAYVEQAPEELYAGASRFRRRLRLDTYGHYALHADMIRVWRERQGV